MVSGCVGHTFVALCFCFFFTITNDFVKNEVYEVVSKRVLGDLIVLSSLLSFLFFLLYGNTIKIVVLRDLGSCGRKTRQPTKEMVTGKRVRVRGPNFTKTSPSSFSGRMGFSAFAETLIF